MISLSLTTWSDHPLFTRHPDDYKSHSTLPQYASYLPAVEVDMPFYRIPPISTVKNWQRQVPKQFQFILKANRLMTRHDYYHPATSDERNITFKRFQRCVEPLLKRHQLKTVLFQFPPYFQRNPKNMNYLKEIRRRLPKLPITVEFRNPSWYRDRNIETWVAKLLARLGMTEAIVDEPHNVNNGVPFLPVITNHRLIVLRLHGRNSYGWFHQGKNWRKTRTLYRYRPQELRDLAHLVKSLSKDAHEVCVIFNNNSAKDAAPNALQLKHLLHLKFKHLAPRQPRQMKLF
ncbi:MAG: DUF72 domain-containing protein [Acetilactobacillus jinshanensis]